jgi:pimeloyl-ACP methyl ester carboxylesterase
MKKNYMIIILICSILLTAFSGCTEQEKETNQEPDKNIPLETKAEYYIENLTTANYEPVFQDFTNEMKSVLPIEDLEYLWESLTSSYGEVEEIIKTRQTEELGYDIVYVTCSFSKEGLLDLRFVFDDKENIAGFQIVPTQQYSTPDYVNKSSFTEQNITIGSKPWKLPATVSIPNGSGPFPAVVLVHGSGPNDRDESIYSNKPFKDIAQGLASNGILVLRYDKRTYVYPEKCAALTNLTPDDEVVDDALIAINYLKNHSKVNQSQLFVLGHSLGAMMTPEIARQTNDLAGAIMLAAPARSFEDLYLYQINYLADLDGVIDETEQEQINTTERLVQKIKNLNISTNETVLNAPYSYWKYLSNYDPVETAENLSIPLLIIQGKRDYQVTYEDDFSIWNETFSDSLTVTLKTYESLNHLFISGTGTPTNTEYLSPGNVDESVIIDISNWIKN